MFVPRGHVVVVVSVIHVHVNCLLLRRNVASVDTKLTCNCLFLTDYVTHTRTAVCIMRLELKLTSFNCCYMLL